MEAGSSNGSPPDVSPIFDAHFHVIDPRFLLVAKRRLPPPPSPAPTTSRPVPGWRSPAEQSSPPRPRPGHRRHSDTIPSAPKAPTTPSSRPAPRNPGKWPPPTARRRSPSRPRLIQRDLQVAELPGVGRRPFVASGYSWRPCQMTSRPEGDLGNGRAMRSASVPTASAGQQSWPGPKPYVTKSRRSERKRPETAKLPRRPGKKPSTGDSVPPSPSNGWKGQDNEPWPPSRWPSGPGPNATKPSGC